MGAPLVLLALSGCGGAGWEVTDGRVCAPDSAPRVCVAGEDHGEVVEVGGTTLVPEECARSLDASGGVHRVEIVDAEGGRRRRSVLVARASIVTLRLRGERRARVTRARCDRRAE